MNNKSFPDDGAYPILTPIVTYWRGLDIISEHWFRTNSYRDKEPNSDEFQEYIFWRKNLVIWACCTIESFVNMEGISWMGEEFYKYTVERQNIVQKIRLIYALKYNKILPRDENTIGDVREIFELRNKFVHPKTRSANKDGKENNLESDNLEKFYEQIHQMYTLPDSEVSDK